MDSSISGCVFVITAVLLLSSPAQVSKPGSPLWTQERACGRESGPEPNWSDRSCRTFYRCRDHLGVLTHCTPGHQFHARRLLCLPDQDVYCTWQLERHLNVTRASRPSRTTSGSSSSAVMSESEEGGHLCRIAEGLEPNFEDSESCSSYWRCQDHRGTLQFCQGADQFSFQYKTYLDDNDVSCWMQMEKFYHGEQYLHSEGDDIASTKKCNMAQGQEPNYYDEGCKSYWYCEDWSGTLHECPAGFQFHWGKLDCVLDVEVNCGEWSKHFYETVIYKQLHGNKDVLDATGDTDGGQDGERVFTLHRPARGDMVDGNWANWGSWGSCSVTCGSGITARSRTCTNPTPSHGGNQCSGWSNDIATCIMMPCPVHGNWANWVSLSSCSVTCGLGIMARYRTCTNPAPAHGGNQCPGWSVGITVCIMKLCSGFAVDGNWANWASWGSCSVTCGSGITARSRTCTNPAPAHGGSQCSGSSSSSTTCTMIACPHEWSTILVIYLVAVFVYFPSVLHSLLLASFRHITLPNVSVCDICLASFRHNTLPNVSICDKCLASFRHIKPIHMIHPESCLVL